MFNIEELFQKMKSADDKGNIILPKEYLKKFILLNLLIVRDNLEIPKDKIFDYLKNDSFHIPSSYDNLDESKQKKYLDNLEVLIKLFYLEGN
jgi:hypothetical protein